MVERTTLPNGIRVITEHVPGARSVSIGIQIGVGSLDDPLDKTRISPLLRTRILSGHL